MKLFKGDLPMKTSRMVTIEFSSDGGKSDVLFIDKRIEAIFFKKDKHANEYARIIVNETHTLNGIPYDRGVRCMVFGDLVVKARMLKKGQRLQGVARIFDDKFGVSYKMYAIMGI
jgi:hypothetical protein